MTNPNGRCFISYRRTRAAEIKSLAEALHERGVPTWQDTRNLAEEQTEDALRHALEDPLTASAVMWITPEVSSSTIIKTIEAPGIVSRMKGKDAFYVVPVVAGGLDYKSAANAIGDHLTADDLSTWNLRKVDSDPADHAEISELADRVLIRRMGMVHKGQAAEKPIAASFSTRKTPAFDPSFGLVIDWTHKFDPRNASQEDWNLRFLPALESIAKAAETQASGRSFSFSGLPSIPAAVALGCTFLSTRRIRISWRQWFPDQKTEQEWSLSVSPEDSGFTKQITPRGATATDLAVLVSVAAAVDNAFNSSKAGLPEFRAVVEIKKLGGPSHVLSTPGQAVHLADLIKDAIREARAKYVHVGTVHLFMAVPVGLAVMVGQQLNTLGLVQTYELDSSIGATGIYKPAALLRPSI